MKMNLKRVQHYAEKGFNALLKGYDFECEYDDDDIKSLSMKLSDITVCGYSILLSFAFFDNGVFILRAMFDEVDLDIDTAEAAFSAMNNTTLRLIIDEFLCAELAGCYFREGDVEELVQFYLNSLVNLVNDNEDMQTLLEDMDCDN